MSIYSEYKAVQELLKINRTIIFYAESRQYYQYFQKLIEDLLEKTSLPVCYITSDRNDPLLSRSPGRLYVVYVRLLLGFLFPRLKSAMVIMTMPDLDNFLFKRSKHVGSYAYMFHAAVSTHQQYRKEAFFNYDCIFCTGTYQVLEIKAAERQYGLKEKDIVEYGYPLFDWIHGEYIKASEKRNKNGIRKILIAPSWYEYCIFETCLEELIENLSLTGHEIIIRFHPEYIKRRKARCRAIQKIVEQQPNIFIDHSADVLQSLKNADVLITDRSGIAFEYAFGTNRPVLFVDTDLKINNPDWIELKIQPIENSIRSEIGISVLPGELSTVRDKLVQLKRMEENFGEQIKQLKKGLFFNSPDFYDAAIRYVVSKVRKS